MVYGAEVSTVRGVPIAKTSLGHVSFHRNVGKWSASWMPRYAHDCSNIVLCDNHKSLPDAIATASRALDCIAQSVLQAVTKDGP